jgi:hypothetical protein
MTDVDHKFYRSSDRYGLRSRPGLLIDAPSIPEHTAQPPLYAPPSSHKDKPSKHFNLLQHFGHMSPWYSTEHGLGSTASSVQPEGCKIKGVHWLQRHGARYPTSNPEGGSCVGIVVLGFDLFH